MRNSRFFYRHFHSYVTNHQSLYPYPSLIPSLFQSKMSIGWFIMLHLFNSINFVSHPARAPRGRLYVALRHSSFRMRSISALASAFFRSAEDWRKACSQASSGGVISRRENEETMIAINGKWWLKGGWMGFYGILWGLPSNLWHRYGKSMFFSWKIRTKMICSWKILHENGWIPWGVSPKKKT